MNVHDWFEDNNITEKLSDLVVDLKKEIPSTSDDSPLDIFLKGLSGIIRTAYHYPDAAHMMVTAILDPDKDTPLNSLIERSFYAVTGSLSTYELQKLEYKEDGHKVSVDFKMETEDDS